MAASNIRRGEKYLLVARGLVVEAVSDPKPTLEAHFEYGDPGDQEKAFPSGTEVKLVDIRLPGGKQETVRDSELEELDNTQD